MRREGEEREGRVGEEWGERERRGEGGGERERRGRRREGEEKEEERGTGEGGGHRERRVVIYLCSSCPERGELLLCEGIQCVLLFSLSRNCKLPSCGEMGPLQAVLCNWEFCLTGYALPFT